MQNMFVELGNNAETYVQHQQYTDRKQGDCTPSAIKLALAEVGRKHGCSSYEKRDRWKRTTSSGGISYCYFLTGEQDVVLLQLDFIPPKQFSHSLIRFYSIQTILPLSFSPSSPIDGSCHIKFPSLNTSNFAWAAVTEAENGPYWCIS